jgi:hypothetical protein
VESHRVDGDYLWDKSGQPDPEVQRLETLMGALRNRRPAPELPAGSPSRPELAGVGTAADFKTRDVQPRTTSDSSQPRRIPGSRRIDWRAWAAAAVVLLVAGAAWMVTRSGRGPLWDVAWLEGTSWADAQVTRSEQLAAGDWIDAGTDRVRLSVGRIGLVELEPGTRARLVDAGERQHRLSLAHGTMHALIWAPPGQFYVDTPSALAVDLGCRYTLEVAPDGSGVLRVEAGWVGFEHDGRVSLVPAGAVGDTRPGAGPGTPHFEDAPPQFSAALDVLDFGGASGAAREAALDTVLASARERDALSLWHLLTRLDASTRGRVFDRLTVLVAPPPGVTRDGVLRGDRAMLDAWWEALGYGSADLWRTWTRPWDGSSPTKAPGAGRL